MDTTRITTGRAAVHAPDPLGQPMEVAPAAIRDRTRRPGGGLRNTAKLMRRDLAAAGLPYFDEEGLVADFHSNRAAFITRLIASRALFFRVVELARHSDPKLTKRYDKSTQEELPEDVHRLPAPPSTVANSQPASPDAPVRGGLSGLPPPGPNRSLPVNSVTRAISAPGTTSAAGA